MAPISKLDSDTDLQSMAANKKIVIRLILWLKCCFLEQEVRSKEQAEYANSSWRHKRT
jgi:hypothetical protein